LELDSTCHSELFSSLSWPLSKPSEFSQGTIGDLDHHHLMIVAMMIDATMIDAMMIDAMMIDAMMIVIVKIVVMMIDTTKIIAQKV
jgi:hypothetical protein